MEVSRRTFLKGAAIGAIGVAAIGSVGTLGGCKSAGSDEGQTYTASAKGCHGDVTATAVISDGKIKSLAVEGPFETPKIGTLALESLPNTIIEKNGVDVDAVSGATLTSVAVLKATAYCMTKAGMSVDVAPPAQNYKAGTYTAAYKGHMGPVNVKVTFSANKIDKIELGTNTDTPSLVNGAFGQLSTQIVKDQSLAVDAVSTATYSSRAILQGVADCVKQAGGDPAALRRPVLSNPTVAADEETSCDVVIVGGGTSGSIALYRTASAGLKTICVESAPLVGGMGEIAGFSKMLWLGSSLQKKALNLTDDAVAKQVKTQADLMLKVRMSEGDMRQFINLETQCGKMVDMLEAAGMPLKVVDALGIGINPKGSRWQFLHEKAAALGAKTLRSHRADKLLVDDQGKISGVVAKRNDGSLLTIKAKAVIVCSGGASANHKMMADYYPDWNEYAENCAISSVDGTAIQAAWNAGAAKGYFGVHAHNHTLPLTAKIAGISTVEATDDVATLGNIPVLWLNRDGKRFGNEETSYLPTPGGNIIYMAKRAFNVVDQATIDTFIKSGTAVRPWRGIAVNTPLAKLAQQLADGEKTGYIYKADTIEKLAEKTGWDPKVASAEVARYNKMVEAKNDTDYFRTPVNLLYKIATPPFYAVELHPRSLGSFGGLVTTADYEVIKADGEPIHGLFAAGDVSAGWFGPRYPDIDALTSHHNTTSGYVAANSVISYLKS